MKITIETENRTLQVKDIPIGQFFSGLLLVGGWGSYRLLRRYGTPSQSVLVDVRYPSQIWDHEVHLSFYVFNYIPLDGEMTLKPI